MPRSRCLPWLSQELERAAREAEQREVDIARGNPLLNPQDFNIKRRWDDDVVFKNQARGTEDKRGKEFVNVRTERPGVAVLPLFKNEFAHA